MDSQELIAPFLAGWCSGAAGIFVTQPLDFIIVRLQSTNVNSQKKALTRNLLIGNGLRALWKGAPVMMGVVPVQNALLFAGYDAGIKFSRVSSLDGNGCGEIESGPLWHVFLGGCVGGFAQSFLASPVELLKVRMQVNPSGAQANGAMAMAARLSLQAKSLRWTGRGLTATLWRDVIPHGVWFASYEGAKRYFSKDENEQLGVGPQVFAGAFAATVAWCVGYPFDVIKTRMQLERNERSFLETIRDIRNNHGPYMFWRGLPLKLARAVPMSIVGFFVYEKSLTTFENLNEKRL